MAKILVEDYDRMLEGVDDDRLWPSDATLRTVLRRLASRADGREIFKRNVQAAWERAPRVAHGSYWENVAAIDAFIEGVDSDIKYEELKGETNF